MKPSEIEPLPPSLEQLLAIERVVPKETAIDSTDVLNAVKGQLAGAAAAAAPGAAAGALGGKVLLAAISFVLGGATVAGLQAWRGAPEAVAPIVITINAAPPAPVTAPVTAPVAAVVAPPPVLPPVRAVAPTPAPAVTAEPVVAPAPVTDDSLAEERALLEVARTALGRGRAAEALTALGEHEQKFSRGRLAEEREGLRVQALLSLDRVPEARARLEAFKLEHPESILVPALEDALHEKE